MLCFPFFILCVLTIWTFNQDNVFNWKVKNHQVPFQPLWLSLDGKRQIFLCFFPSTFPGWKWSVDVNCLFGKLEARETGVLLDVFLAHSFVLYSSSHSGGLASGASWLSSTLRRYWCLAMKYCIYWEVAKAHKRWETVIILGYAEIRLLFSCAKACVCCASLCMCQLCFSVFDFSIFHLSGWQFKTTEWNISEPSSKLQWHTHEVIVILSKASFLFLLYGAHFPSIKHADKHGEGLRLCTFYQYELWRCSTAMQIKSFSLGTSI